MHVPQHEFIGYKMNELAHTNILPKIWFPRRTSMPYSLYPMKCVWGGGGCYHGVFDADKRHYILFTKFAILAEQTFWSALFFVQKIYKIS